MKERERRIERQRERGEGERENKRERAGRERWKRSREMGHEGFMPLAVVGGWIVSRGA